jgi:ankyrin repeat protein
MHIAVKHGQLSIVNQLMDLGCVEADIPNAQNATPLITAARTGNAEVVDFLLEKKASVEHKDRRENTAFLAAAFSSSLSLEVLEMLFNAGSDIDVADERGVGAVHAATIQKNATMVDWLLARHATVDLTTQQQTTPLMMAARGGQMDLVDRFLQAGADPLKTDPHGMTALHLAAHEGRADMVRKLLAYGQSVSSETGLGPADRLCSGGRNALFLAVFGESQETVAVCAEAGARVNILDDEGYSPLFRACGVAGEAGLALVETLLKAKADPNLCSFSGGVTLKAQESSDAAPSAEELAISALPDVRTPLQLCALTARRDIATALIAHKADVDAQPGAYRFSPVHLSLIAGDEDLCADLCKAGARSSEDAQRRTQAMLAEQLGRSVPTLASPKALMEALPPIAPTEHKSPAATDPGADALAEFCSVWAKRDKKPGDVLDTVMGPELHDAFHSPQWRTREAAVGKVRGQLLELEDVAPVDLVQAALIIVEKAAEDKVQKVFIASLQLLDEVLADSGVAELPEPKILSLADNSRLFSTLLAKSEDSNAQVSRHALDMYLSLVYSGRFSLEAVVLPLVMRLRDQVLPFALSALQDRLGDEKNKNKSLSSLLKVVLKVLSSFGLGETGIFRRAFLLPMLLICMQHPHEKVKSKALEGVLKIVHLTGGIPDEAFKNLRSGVIASVTDAVEKQGPKLVTLASAEDTLPLSQLGPPFPTLCMEQMPRLNAEMVERMLKTQASESLATPEALRAKLSAKNWQEREECAQALKLSLQQDLDATQPDAWTTTAEGAQNRVPATDVLQMSFGGVDIRFLIEATGTLLQDQVAAVFSTGLDLLTAFCDSICRQREHPDLAENVFPYLVASVLTPLLGKMQDSSKRVQRKATNAIMYVATFGEGAAEENGAGASFLVLEVAKAEDGAKKTAVLPRIEILRQLLTRPAVASGLLPEARAMTVDFLARLLDHRQQEVRQLSLKGIVQAAGQGWAEVPALVARLDPKSQQRRALRKAGLEATRPSGNNDSGAPMTPGRSERGDSRVVFASPMQEEVGSVVSARTGISGVGAATANHASSLMLPLPRTSEEKTPELPFAEPIAEDAKDFVQPLVDVFGDPWARCWYSPQWQLRVAALEWLMSKIEGSFGELPPEDVFDACMRVLNEGLGDQVVKVYFSAGALLPQVLMKFTPVLEGQLIRAHVAPLLLHLMTRMGDQKEAVRSKTTQTLFNVLATGASRPTMVAQLVLDSLMGKGETITGKGASSVHGWMCRLSVLRDLVRDYDVCADLKRPQHWLGALIPGVNHGAVPVRNAAIQLFVQVYKRCTTMVETEDTEEADKEKREAELNALKEEWVKALPAQVQQKMKRVLFEDSDKENQLPEEKEEKKKKTKEDSWSSKDKEKCLAKCLPLFARVEPAELDVLVTAASAPPVKVCAALQQLGKALEWGSMKARSDREKSLPTDLEVFEGLCEVLQHAFEVDDQSVFQASAQLCCAMLKHSDVSSLDVHMSVGKVFPSLLGQTNSSNHKIAQARRSSSSCRRQRGKMA